MKKIYFIAWFVALGGGMLRAQTNANAATQPERPPTIINSDNANFDLLSTPRKAFYYGHVHVDNPKMQLTCEKMVADLPPEGGHISRIVADTNVLIAAINDKGETNHSTSDNAVYVYNVQGQVTNEVITLSGHASATNDADGSTMTGEPLIWDRATGRIYATNEVIIIKQKLSDAMSGTNSASSKTNKPPAPKLF